ncbi:hypothetical protein A2U01_0110727, partial [Trifolium medium]|nr:hypothetical protein [Trifolium medium]
VVVGEWPWRRENDNEDSVSKKKESSVECL